VRSVVTALHAPSRGSWRRVRLLTRACYRAEYVAYQDLSKRHIAELKEPGIKVGSALGFCALRASGW